MPGLACLLPACRKSEENEGSRKATNPPRPAGRLGRFCAAGCAAAWEWRDARPCLVAARSLPACRGVVGWVRGSLATVVSARREGRGEIP